MGAEGYGSAILLWSIQFSRSPHINPYIPQGGGHADASPKPKLIACSENEKMSHLPGKKNRLERFWKEYNTDDGAEARKYHHDPEYPAPPKMTNSDATEKIIRHVCAQCPHQYLLATDNWSKYWPQKYIHCEYACRDAASRRVPYVGD
jgi:hypothetical protein